MNESWPSVTIDSMARTELQVEAQPLSGGLVSNAVLAVTSTYRDEGGRCRTSRCVKKQLHGRALREAAIYQALARTPARSLVPELLGLEPASGGGVWLCLERVEAVGPWPWRDTRAAGEVLRVLARLHVSAGAELAASAGDWCYEDELEQRAQATLAALGAQRGRLRSQGIDVRLALVRRLVGALRALRRELLAGGVLPPTGIHGDVHSGNVLWSDRRPGGQPVFLDWERARVGSPLEDVSSWLESLAFWEPEVRRRHDSLLGEYLAERGLRRLPPAELRRRYWLAAASNSLSGALLYHLARAGDERQPSEVRHLARRAVHDQLRVLRRAEALCC